jgi:phospholipase/lecithinase/hemolysin
MASSLPTFSTIYAFGDSLSDAGNVSISTASVGITEPVSPPYAKEQYGSSSGTVFSNGPTWVQDLSVALGLGTLAPSLAGGTDFAYGGAETGSTPQNAGNPGVQVLSLPVQLTQFQATTLLSGPSARALYTVSIGGNDVLDILSNTSLTAAQQAADVSAAVANEITFLKQLVSAGATNLLVLDVPDLGKTPDVLSGAANGSHVPSAALDATASQLAASYNAQLMSQIPSLGSATVHVVDAYQLIDAATASPALYNLTNATSPVWSGNFTSASSGTLAATTAAAQDQYLFWDQLHPTESGHLAIADLGEQLLSGRPALQVQDATTGKAVTAEGQAYTGPVSGLQQQYAPITADNLDVAATTPDWFIHTGAGNDAIAVSSGNNVLDGGAGSNFLVGGSGTDTFFVDDRASAAAVWSTVADFHAGDAATIFGLAPGVGTLTYADGQGATGYTGLTLHATTPGTTSASLTLAGFTTADLSNGRLSVSSGTIPATGGAAALPYLYIHANS